MREVAKANRRVPAIFALVLAILVLGGLGLALRQAWVGYYRAAYPLGYYELVMQYSAERDLPPALVFAVIRSESGFDHAAYSYAYAKGLMQITEETFEWVRMRMGDDQDRPFEEMFIPEVNIRYGTMILRLHLDHFGGEREAIAAYHAGRRQVALWLGDTRFSDDGITLRDTPFRKTNAYLHNVLFARDIYLALYDLDN